MSDGFVHHSWPNLQDMTDTPQIIQNPDGIWMLSGEQLWDSDILPICLEHIKEGDTVIDAGAWIGGHTMAYARLVGESGDVIAFEPNPYAFTCLYRNTTPFLNVRCDQIALGIAYALMGLSAEKGWYDSGYVSDDGNVAEVNMRPLDHYDIVPNFIKIDVEGCELKVLKGADKTIEKSRPKMMIEINRPALERQGTHPNEILCWLRDNNYSYDVIGNTLNDVYNILCLPQ